MEISEIILRSIERRRANIWRDCIIHLLKLIKRLWCLRRLRNRSNALTSIHFFAIWGAGILYWIIYLMNRLYATSLAVFLNGFHAGSHAFFFIDREYLELRILDHRCGHSLGAVIILLCVLQRWRLRRLFRIAFKFHLQVICSWRSIISSIVCFSWAWTWLREHPFEIFINFTIFWLLLFATAVVVRVKTDYLIISILCIFSFHYFEFVLFSFWNPWAAMIKIKLWLLAIANLFSINIDIYIWCLAHYLQSWINTYGLSNSEIVDCVMSIRNSFDIDECLSSQVWFIVVSFDGSHAVLV